MAIKSYKPYTPSRRHMTGSDFSEITKTKPEKSLVVSLKKNAGRNNQGKITCRHRGGGSRRKYRLIDFKRRKDDVPATVKSIEYDPNRSANIALLAYADGEKTYILAPEGLKVGQKVMNGEHAEIRRYTDPQHRAVSRPRRPAGAFCRQQRTADGKRRKICDCTSPIRRDAHGPDRMPRHSGCSRKRRPQPDQYW